ncbi:phosphoadenosine phosphosulfate reductase domain-containing protein [Vibrio coralliilyticus]|uniref:Phosphoadenosine phosphosulfate reductase family protein n=1 Tax=Vibrio coralliilyticus TaxID=190893 RepID=A0AAP6ZNR9_9VIBR|nr:phosphoadenosine phosphosulfate reductase family protein [Vibrio coralliilyticus]NOI32255.1 phosphoadenosine phosphosulfate reductase family protein [Vibrio coralliilyticus]NOJ25339.1 phosphoadenosine phosphosulfate reductase family protein [Vibrio coralliilyticus]
MSTAKKLIHAVQFSGGRTSGYMVHLMERARREFGWDVRYIFCDTGVEAPQTYVFIRNVVKFWNIDLTILRAKVNPQLGVGNGYEIFEPKDLMNSSVMPPFQPFFDMIKKYGTPNIGGPYCSERMKKDVADKYCKEHFGKDGYISWLGIRGDELQRLKPKSGIKYLADLVPMVHKEDVNEWWSHQEFDLNLDESEGNCLFCFKKSTPKIALAIKRNPHFLQMWQYYIGSSEVREKDGYDKNIMYRGHLSLNGIAELYSDSSEDQIKSTMRRAKRYEAGACTESCEGFKLHGEEINFDVVETELYRQFQVQLKQTQLAFA